MSMRPSGSVALLLALAACTSQGAPHRSQPSPPAPSDSQAQRLCAAALARPIAASSLTTVADVRDFVTGGPSPMPGDRSRQPGKDAFPGAARTDTAAWCTVGSDGAYTFFAASGDGKAVEIEGVGGITGPVPDHPVLVP